MACLSTPELQIGTSSICWPFVRKTLDTDRFDRSLKDYHRKNTCVSSYRLLALLRSGEQAKIKEMRATAQRLGLWQGQYTDEELLGLEEVDLIADAADDEDSTLYSHEEESVHSTTLVSGDEAPSSAPDHDQSIDDSVSELSNPVIEDDDQTVSVICALSTPTIVIHKDNAEDSNHSSTPDHESGDTSAAHDLTPSTVAISCDDESAIVFDDDEEPGDSGPHEHNVLNHQVPSMNTDLASNTNIANENLNQQRKSAKVDLMLSPPSPSFQHTTIADKLSWPCQRKTLPSSQRFSTPLEDFHARRLAQISGNDTLHVDLIKREYKRARMAYMRQRLIDLKLPPQYFPEERLLRLEEEDLLELARFFNNLYDDSSSESDTTDEETSDEVVAGGVVLRVMVQDLVAELAECLADDFYFSISKDYSEEATLEV